MNRQSNDTEKEERAEELTEEEFDAALYKATRKLDEEEVDDDSLEGE
ncbi:MAG: hypothetical protein O3B43_04185 [Chloroflexi bacterium]|nr:hypothetical protein [Chloroflexota bacterium]